MVWVLDSTESALDSQRNLRRCEESIVSTSGLSAEFKKVWGIYCINIRALRSYKQWNVSIIESVKGEWLSPDSYYMGRVWRRWSPMWWPSELSLSRLSPSCVLLLLSTNLDKQTGSSSILPISQFWVPTQVWVLDTRVRQKTPNLLNHFEAKFSWFIFVHWFQKHKTFYWQVSFSLPSF